MPPPSSGSFLLRHWSLYSGEANGKDCGMVVVLERLEAFEIGLANQSLSNESCWLIPISPFMKLPMFKL